MKKFFLIFCLAFFSIVSFGQTVKLLTSGTRTSLRGLSVVNDSVLWASGSGGMVIKSTDGGATFSNMVVKGFEKTEFRDIEAFNANTAIIMAIDSPAFLLKTIDGGLSWKEIFRNDTRGIFLDAMEFDSDGNGIVLGDPLDAPDGSHHFYLAKGSSTDLWSGVAGNLAPIADKGEACFASSGTNIRIFNGLWYFVSGGMSAHFYSEDVRVKLPLVQGKESTGANSIAVKNKKKMIVVGGDFNLKDAVVGNCAFTKDGGKTWNLPNVSPTGYRSCVEYLYKNTWLTCGLNGVDVTKNDGSNFTQISRESYHVCRKAKRGNAVFLAGNNGKIGKLL